MIHEQKFDETKNMTLETTASKLTTRLKQVNPEVTLEIAKNVMESDDDVKEKIVSVYSLNQTQHWIDDVRNYLKI